MPHSSSSRAGRRLARHLAAASALGLCAPAWPLAAQRAAPDTARPAISPDRVEAVARFVERNHGRLGLPGVAVSVATGDSVVLAIGHGDAGNGHVIDGRTPFFIGSVTKTLTATAVAQLAAEGRLDLDAPVESYLPDFTMRPPFSARSITPRHLLQHRSGFSQWSGHDARAQRDGEFAHLSPARGPDERSEYSSLNFIVLGRVLERASGQWYGDRIERSLFQPLGMSDAFASGVRSTTAAVRGHQSWFGFQVGRREPEPPRHLIPAGFVAASAQDMARFGGMLVGGGALGGERLLDSATVAALLGPLDTAGRAMAWGRQRLRGALVLEHAGNARTSSARVRLVPERGYAITVLANTNSGPFFPATADLMEGIHAILEGEDAPDPFPRERLFKGALLLGTAMSIVQMGARARRWDRAGRPTRLRSTSSVLVPLAVDLAGAGVVLVGIPRFVGVPLGTMTEYFPDLGVALVTSAVAGVAGGVLASWTRSGAAQ